MSRLLDFFETTVVPSYRIFGLVDATVDMYSSNVDYSRWLVSAPGMVYLQVPPQVIRAFVRLESWSTAPPEENRPVFRRGGIERGIERQGSILPGPHLAHGRTGGCVKASPRGGRGIT